MEIKDFINNNTVIHCDTEEKAREFINKAYGLGYKWGYDEEDTIYYNKYGCNICYKLNEYNKIITCSDFDYYKRYNYTIIEYEFGDYIKKLTPLEYFMEYWGINEGEKFNVVNAGFELPDGPYYIKNGRLYDKLDKLHRSIYYGFLNGSYKIQKLPWKPKNGDIVWYIGADEGVYDVAYTGTVSNLAMLKNGWFFRTKKEVEANMERLLKEYTEVLGND